MIVAVTGASGFVGGHVVRALVQRGHHVHAYGNRPEHALVQPLPSYRSWDVRAGKIEAPHVDAVVHCAALVGDWGPEQAYRAVNVEGTRAMIASFPDARIVYVSSSSVYSDHQPRTILDETSPIGDCRFSAYGRTKAAGEKVALSTGRATVLRPHIVYGPGDNTLLPRVIASRRFGRLFVPGNGQNQVSVTHVSNLADAAVLAVERADVHGVFNVCDAETSTLDELLRTLLTRAGISPRLTYVPAPLAMAAATTLERIWLTHTPPRGPRITRYVVQQMISPHTLDIQRARTQLGYVPRMNVRMA